MGGGGGGGGTVNVTLSKYGCVWEKLIVGRCPLFLVLCYGAYIGPIHWAICNSYYGGVLTTSTFSYIHNVVVEDMQCVSTTNSNLAS